MSRRPMSARARRQALRKEIERVSQIADQRLAEAVRDGLVAMSDLPLDVASSCSRAGR